MNAYYAFTDKPYYGYEDPLFLTNFIPEREPIFEEAIMAYHKEVGENVLIITDNAEPYGPNATVDPKAKALRFLSKRRDLSRFWAIYRSLQANS